MLKEQVVFLDEVVFRPKINKEEPLNKMALAGGRMFSVEETSRYAGVFDMSMRNGNNQKYEHTFKQKPFLSGDLD